MKKNKLHIKLIIIIILIPILSVLGLTFSKYIIEEFHSYFLNSKHFYFTSNRLKEDNPLYQINNWSGVGTFTISLNLLSEKNSYVFSDYDIPYEISYTCPSDVICSSSKDAGIIYKDNVNHSDTVIISVTPTRSYLENEVLTVHIDANSTSPYVKTISADFKYVVGKQGVTYSIEDEPNQPYLFFNVTNAISYCKVIEAFDTYPLNFEMDNSIFMTLSDENKKKCVSQNIKIDFNPSIILIDTTNNLIDESIYTNTNINGEEFINHLEFPINPLSTIAIKFYKVMTYKNYTYPGPNVTSVVDVTITDP